MSARVQDRDVASLSMVSELIGLSEIRVAATLSFAIHMTQTRPQGPLLALTVGSRHVNFKTLIARNGTEIQGLSLRLCLAFRQF